MRDETNVVNLDEYESLGTYWVALYVMAENVTYFDSFVVKHIPKNITTNIYRTQAYDSVMGG